MSRLRPDLITDPALVIPFLKKLFEETLLPFRAEKMYLVGSRGRTPLEQWGTLEGKDYDILIVTPAKITNTKIWTLTQSYYIEINCNTNYRIQSIRKNNYGGDGAGIELFPNTPDEFKSFIL